MPMKKDPAKSSAKSTKVKPGKATRMAEETAAERRKRLAEEKKLSGCKR